MLAQRTTLFASSGTSNARLAAKRAAAEGREIIDFSAGELWSKPSQIIRSAAIAAIEGGVSRYTDTLGLETLRQAVAKRVARQTGLFWEAGEIAVTAGAKQALFNATMTILDPGDEVIVPRPYWSTFPAQVAIAGATPVYLDTADDGYLPSLEKLTAATSGKTRAIILNSPNNPTGRVYDRAFLAQVAAFALERDIWIIFDECYHEFVYAPARHANILTMAPDARPRTLVVNSFSKTLALTGWRIGYLAGPREVVSAVKALQSHTTSNPNVIAQYAILAYLEQNDDSFVREARAELALKRARSLQMLSQLDGVPLPTAEGGFYLYLDVGDLCGRSAGGRELGSADDVARLLLDDAGVATVPGNAFGDPRGLRLSYGLPLAQLEQGLTRIAETLRKLA